MKKICIIDGQGGGIGAAIIKKLKERFEENIEIIALGTNAVATSQMLKVKANKGASGENAICNTVNKVDIIIGTIGIVLANSMLGEVSPRMAEAISSSSAKKILIPLSQENLKIMGLKTDIPLPHLIDEVIQELISQNY